MFDDFASYFEDKLMDDLEYVAPREVARTVAERIGDPAAAAAANDNTDNTRGGRPYASAIDAGCGTGLIGPRLRRLVTGPMVGIDLSPKMVERAAELVADDHGGGVGGGGASRPKLSNKHDMRRVDEPARTAQNLPRLYDGLFVGDLLEMVDGSEPMPGYGHTVTEFPAEPVELIVCADVLCYFGSMGEVLRAFSDRLAPGGDLVFTTETMASGEYSWVQLVSDRYAHSPEYVRAMAEAAGLVTVSQISFSPRLELGEKVLGTLHTFTKPE